MLWLLVLRADSFSLADEPCVKLRFSVKIKACDNFYPRHNGYSEDKILSITQSLGEKIVLQMAQVKYFLLILAMR